MQRGGAVGVAAPVRRGAILEQPGVGQPRAGWGGGFGRRTRGNCGGRGGSMWRAVMVCPHLQLTSNKCDGGTSSQGAQALPWGRWRAPLTHR